MFDRVLLDDGEWYMSLAWFGAGALRVTKPSAKRTVKASPVVKSHLVNVFHALSTRGFDISPKNPRAMEMLRGFAEIAWDPDSLYARTLLSQEPNEIAECLLSIDG
jgi:hypothetical protein